MNITELHEEEFLDFLAAEIQNGKEILSSEYPIQQDKINSLLSKQTPEGLDYLVSLAEDKEFRSKFYSISKIGFFLLAALIYKEEHRRGICLHIFQTCKSLDDIQFLLTSFKHLLWRYEFRTDDSNGKDLLHFISDKQLSPFCTQILIENLAFHKVDVLKRLMFLFYENNYTAHSLSLMESLESYVKGASPENVDNKQ